MLTEEGSAASEGEVTAPYPWEAPSRWAPRGRLVRKLRLRRLVLQEKVFPVGSEVPLHDHPRAKVCLVLAGTCLERRDGRSLRYEPWTLQLNPRQSTHSYRAGSRGLRVFSVTLGPGWGPLETEMLPGSVDAARHAGLLTFAARLYREALRPETASGLVVESLLTELLEVVGPCPDPPPHAAPGWLGRALELLHDRFQESLGLSKVAAEIGIHPAHLARTFRAHTGLTVGEYVRGLRLAHARRLLGSTAHNLADVAALAGFSDQSHMGRVFRRLTGQTPSEARALFEMGGGR